MVLVSLIPYKHFQRYINKVAEAEFKVYLDIWEEISLLQCGLRMLKETKNDGDENDGKARRDLRMRQESIEKLYSQYKELLESRKSIQEFALFKTQMMLLNDSNKKSEQPVVFQISAEEIRESEASKLSQNTIPDTTRVELYLKLKRICYDRL